MNKYVKLIFQTKRSLITSKNISLHVRTILFKTYLDHNVLYRFEFFDDFNRKTTKKVGISNIM